jgi:hypothetical protein
VSVQPFGKAAAKVRPGQTATYIVWVWTTGADAKHVTVDLSTGDSKIKRTSAPSFSVCPDASGTRCTLGTLPKNQADELQARISVWKIATTGKNLTLTATASAKDAKPFKADGAVAVVAAPTPPPSDPPPGDGGLPPPPALPPLPPDPAPLTGSSDPAGLFPTVTPSPASAAESAHAAHRTKVHATSAGNTLPLNTRLIGGQLAGLVILAAAIAIAVARLSFRPQRPDSTPDDD